MSEIKVVAVPPEMIEGIWPKFEAFIAEAIKYSHGDLCEEGLKERLQAKEEVLLAVVEDDQVLAGCVATTRVLDSGRKILYVPVMGGERMDEWLQLGLDALKTLESTLGCEGIRACGRPGWAKALPGAKVLHQIVEF
jgi:hypothetical protein